MGYCVTTPEREKVRQKKLTCTQKTASREIFSYCVKTSQENRSQAPELHQGNRLTSTKIASGIPYWPGRDPLGENGGVNIYSFVKNGSASSIDILGMVTWSPKIQLGNLSIGDMNVSVGINYGGGLSWALANGYLVFSNDGVSGQATGSYYSWGSWGKTGTIEAEISVTCDDEGNISFSPMTDSDIASVQIAAAIDLEAKVSTTDPKSGTIKADIAVSYKEPLSLSASAFGITVHNVGAGVTDKSGKTVTYICECED